MKEKKGNEGQGRGKEAKKKARKSDRKGKRKRKAKQIEKTPANSLIFISSNLLKSPDIP